MSHHATVRTLETVRYDSCGGRPRDNADVPPKLRERREIVAVRLSLAVVALFVLVIGPVLALALDADHTNLWIFLPIGLVIAGPIGYVIWHAIEDVRRLR